MGNKAKISTSGSSNLVQTPFSGLSDLGLPMTVVGQAATAGTNGPGARPSTAVEGRNALRNRGRVDIRRETGNRGGKTVTVVSGFAGISLAEKEQLVKRMRSACGCGGTIKDGQIELQGDKRDQAAKILEEAGFRAVFAGG